MILINDINNPTLTKNATNSSVNKDLWKQELEKNGLNNNSGKIEIIKYRYRSSQDLNSNVEDTAIKFKKIEVLNNFNKNNDDPIKKTDQITQSKIGNGFNELVNQNKKISSEVLHNASTASPVFNNKLQESLKTIQLSSLQGYLSNSHIWKDKNTLITMVNSNAEIWIRDANLTAIKLNAALKIVQQSMAELGASLSKVTINGRVVFQS